MDNIISKIVFTGDIAFDRYMDGRWESEELLSDEIYNFLYDADHVVVNLEGALYKPSDKSVKSDYYHAMEPKAVCALKRMKADILSIANNHIMDAGEEGLVSTKSIAETNKCKSIGAGINETEASQPVYINDKAGGIGIISVGYQNECVPATKDTAGCFSWDNFELILKRIAEIKEKCRWCVVVVHGGEEFSPLPLPYTRERYIKYLQMGADVVVGHHPHVPENYEIFDDGKTIFYSLGNFIFDTDYQRVHRYTDIGVMLKLKFTNDSIGFDALGIRITREEGRVVACDLPDIFTNIQEKDYELLAPLGAKAFIAEDKRKMIYLKPQKYNWRNPENWDKYFFGHLHEDYAKGSHMDFDIVIPLAEEAEKNNWKSSNLTRVKEYILSLL